MLRCSIKVLTGDEYQSSLWFPSLPKNSTHASVIVSGAIYSEITIIGRVDLSTTASGVTGDIVHCVFTKEPDCLGAFGSRSRERFLRARKQIRSSEGRA